jgi:hypothetical protein
MNENKQKNYKKKKRSYNLQATSYGLILLLINFLFLENVYSQVEDDNMRIIARPDRPKGGFIPSLMNSAKAEAPDGED